MFFGLFGAVNGGRGGGGGGGGSGGPAGRLLRRAPQSASASSMAGLLQLFRRATGKTGRHMLSRIILILALLNACFFIFGGITLQVVKEDRDSDQLGGGGSSVGELASRWSSDLELPPQGSTCEAWLADADQVPDLRNFHKHPVVVVGGAERRGWPRCSVGCAFVGRGAGGGGGGGEGGGGGGGGGVDDLAGEAAVWKQGDPCDAELLGGRSSEGGSSMGLRQESAGCALRVIRQENPRQSVRVPNDTNIVAMTTSLSSDVPIGHPTWSDYNFLNPFPTKGRGYHVIAILDDDCRSMQERLLYIADFRKRGVPIDKYGGCVGNDTTPALVRDTICRYRFVLLFEDLSLQDYLSQHFWSSLVCGTVPIVVAKGNIGKFVPADNAFLQVRKSEDFDTVVQWLLYLLKSDDAYLDMVRWKDDLPSDPFVALMDLSVVPAECRLCLHVATQLSTTAESRALRPCRCWEEPSNSTVYHLFIRERGRFDFLPFFLRSSELTKAALVKAVYHLFKRRQHQTIWKGSRPEHLAGPSRLRAFRIYPVEASQDMALQGLAAFKTDEQVRAFVESSPCPKLEVIFL